MRTSHGQLWVFMQWSKPSILHYIPYKQTYIEARFSDQLDSIAEINSGVVCSCMPVIFVLFKGTLDKLVGWLSGLLHLITGHSRDSSNMGPNGGNDIHITLYKCVDGGGQELPQVPKGTVTGLRSFVRNFGRTDVEKTEGHLSTDGNMLTVVSEVYDYHQHFRDGAPWMGQSAST